MSINEGRLLVDGVRIAYRRITPEQRPQSVSEDRPVIVMLHEGLGSITQWRDLPEVLAQRSGLEVFAYDRGGYGRSDPMPVTYSDGFMEREATEVLPAVLHQLGIRDPILIGHSDGASIALIAAGTGAVAPLGVAAIAPHTFIEDICIDGIRAINTHSDRVIDGLARHHDHPRLAFERWRDVWLTPRFRDWDIRHLLADIACPTLVLQGEGDQYGTELQVNAITEAVPNATGHLLADCGHVAHRDQPDRIADHLVAFVADCTSA